MNKNRKQFTVILLLFPLLLAACDNFERNTFQALKLAKAEYEILQDHAARAYVHGRLTPEQWDLFATTGNRFIAAHTLAADLAESYRRVRQTGSENQQQQLQQRLQQALARLPVVLADIHQLLRSFAVEAPALASPAKESNHDRNDQ